MNKIAEIYNTLFFIGYSKWAPGSIGSFISIIIVFLLFNISSYKIFVLLFFIMLLLSLMFISIHTKTLKKKDAKEIIIDEFMGIYLIFIFFNNFNSIGTYLNLLLIFLIFRFFDIFKIFPANIIDKKMNNSYGVIIDDLIAATYSIFVLYLINEFI